MTQDFQIRTQMGPGPQGSTAPRDHGGGLDGAISCFGGQRADWIDLSTGINPCPWPIARADMPTDVWTALPDRAAELALDDAARALWQVPDGMGVLAAPALRH